jgi:hypothetical protein
MRVVLALIVGLTKLLYAANISLAQQALMQNYIGWASELLEQHRLGPGEPDLRGCEWRYIWQQCQSDALATLCRRPAGIHSLSISRGGKFVAAGEFAGGLPSGTSAQGKALTRFLKAGVPSLQHSPRVKIGSLSPGVPNQLSVGRVTWSGFGTWRQVRS